MSNVYHSPPKSNGNDVAGPASWPIDPTARAIRLIAIRKRISIAHAATVAQLAGLGGLPREARP